MSLKLGVLVLSALVAVPVPIPTTAAVGNGPDDPIAQRVRSLPVVAEHRYRMAGRIRPLLLFWIGRDDIGGGRVVTRRGDGGAIAYELVMGSDPDRAPRHLNRWGFLIEEVRGTDGVVLGAMTESDERSLEEAKARLAREGTQGGFFFKAIQATVAADEARASVTMVHTPNNFTYRDVDIVLDLVTKELGRAAGRRVQVPHGARPGFLGALAELIHQSVAAGRRSAWSTLGEEMSVPFVYNATLYDLTLRDAQFLPYAVLGGRSFARVVQGELESRDRTAGNRTRFQVIYGTEGPLAEVPVHVVYRPRWWLEVQLTLDEEARSDATGRNPGGHPRVRGETGTPGPGPAGGPAAVRPRAHATRPLPPTPPRDSRLARAARR